MKFILTLKICSALFMNCQASVENTIKFNSWIECANAGYSNAIEINNICKDHSCKISDLFDHFTKS